MIQMKLKIKNFDGKVVELEKTTSSPDHLKAQQMHKKIVFRDKTKYTRKNKHKNKEEQ